MGIRVGIDTGGTFTDLVAVDEQTRRLVRREGPVDARRGRWRRSPPRSSRREFDPGDVSFIVVGTTIGINAVLTRTGARVIYLTTKGFEDVPHIQRINRKNHYDFVWRKPAPLAPPARLHRHRRAHRRRGRGRPRARRRRGARRGPGAPRRRRRGRRGRRLPPVLLREPGLTSCAVRDALARATRAPGLALARGRADLARVRARHGGDPRRLRQADHAAATSPASRGASGAGRRRAVVAAEVERRARALAARRASGPAHVLLSGIAGGAIGGALLRARGAGAARPSCSTWAARAATSA